MGRLQTQQRAWSKVLFILLICKKKPKKHRLFKFSGKQIELEKKIILRGNSEPKRQISYVLTYMWMTAVKLLTSKLQSILPQRLGRQQGVVGRDFSLGNRIQ